jgi:hypothetical protein
LEIVSGTRKLHGLAVTCLGDPDWIDVDWLSPEPSCAVVEGGGTVSCRVDGDCACPTPAVIAIAIVTSKA